MAKSTGTPTTVVPVDGSAAGNILDVRHFNYIKKKHWPFNKTLRSPDKKYNAAGYAYIEQKPDGTYTTYWTDADGKNICTLPGIYLFDYYCQIMVAKKYGTFEDYKNGGTVLSIDEYNLEGKHIGHYDGYGDFISRLFFINDGESKRERKKYDMDLSGVVVSETAPGSGMGQFYYLGEKIGEPVNIDFSQADKRKVRENCEKAAKKIWGKVLKKIENDPEHVEKFKSLVLDPAIRAYDHNDSILTNPRNIKIAGRPVTIATNDKGRKYFSRDGQPVTYNTDTYDEVKPMGEYAYLCSNADTLAIVMRNGDRLVEFESIVPIDFRADDQDLYLVTFFDDEYKRIIAANGMPIGYGYQDIIPCHTPEGDGAYILLDGLWQFHNFKWYINSMCFYDYISEFDESGTAKTFYKGHEGSIDYNGFIVTPVWADLLEKGRNRSLSASERYNCLLEALKLAKRQTNDDMGEINYMLGQLCEEAGDLGQAIDYYNDAELLAYPGAESARKRVKTNIVCNALNTIADGISNAASILSGQGGAGTYTSGNWGSMSTSSGGGGSYEAQYRNWERRARANYDSLTNVGTRSKKNGKDSHGTTGQSMSGGNYLAMKRSLREAQDEMQKIRQKAAANGVTIQQSTYETVTVNY